MTPTFQTPTFQTPTALTSTASDMTASITVDDRTTTLEHLRTALRGIDESGVDQLLAATGPAASNGRPRRLAPYRPRAVMAVLLQLRWTGTPVTYRNVAYALHFRLTEQEMAEIGMSDFRHLVLDGRRAALQDPARVLGPGGDVAGRWWSQELHRCRDAVDNVLNPIAANAT